jgi:hypothetical protein
MFWSKQEVTLIVQDYLSMLALELRGISYNKTEHRRDLGRIIPNRLKAIEFKHCNISGVLAKMGLPYIKGYKPLYNFQSLLADEVAAQILIKKADLNPLFKSFVNDPVSVKNLDFATVEENGPVKSKFIEREPRFLPFKTNYLKKEQDNRVTGRGGEQFVLNFERWRLIRQGKNHLAKMVSWDSKKKGDGLGYDILSWNDDESVRYIEVKTTKLAKESPIFVSRREFLFSKKHPQSFYLYRVFEFKTKPRLFIRQGQFDDFFMMIPKSYTGYPLK